MVTINGSVYDADFFAWDECHKIYLIMNEADEQEAKGCGYELYPVSKLKEVWRESCPLKFIYTWDLEVVVIPQFYEGYVHIAA